MNNGNSTLIDDPQNYINELGDTVGQSGEGDANRKVYSSTNYLTNGENHKQGLEALDTQMFTNRGDIDSNDTDIAALDGRVTTIEGDYGVANGLATLDGTGKIPSSQLTLEAMEFKGAFDASGGGSGSPSLTNGSGNTGDTYRVSVGGTVDHGAGNVTYAAGDLVAYDGSVWQIYQTVNAVAPVDSVNGQTGVVVLDADDIAQTTTRYWGIKHNRSTTVDPTAADDSNDNYSIGSTWFNYVNGKKFVLQDGTIGNAVWIETGGAGSGVGGINYITNFDFETDTSDWTGDTNLVISQETTSPLRGDGSLKIAKGGVDASTQQVYADFTIHTTDLAKKLTISFDKDFSAMAADGDFVVKIFQDPTGTNTEIAVNGDEIRADKTVHYAQFQTDHTELDYRLVIECVTTSTSAYDLFADNVIVGPRAVASSAFMTDWVSFTPTGSWTGAVTYTGFWRRVGDRMEVTARVDTSGAPTGSALQFDLPAGYTIDTSKLVGTRQNYAVIEGTATLDSGPGGYKAYILYYDTTTVAVAYQSSTAGGGSLVTSTAPFTFGASDAAEVVFSVPIQGWSSNAVSSEDLGQRDVRIRASGNGSQTVTSGVPIPFTLVEDTTSSYGGAWGGSEFTAPQTGDYIVTGSLYASVGQSDWRASMVIDGGTSQTVGYEITTGRVLPFSGVIRLQKGQTLSIESNKTFTLTNTAVLHWMTIRNLASPQTTLETETVAASYTSNSGQTVTNNGQIIYEDLTFDTHNMYDTSTGIGVAPVSGKYLVCASAKQNAALAMFIEVRINGVRRAIFRASADSNEAPNGSVLVEINKGETFVINNVSGANRTLTTGGAADNFFTIHRIK